MDLNQRAELAVLTAQKVLTDPAFSHNSSFVLPERGRERHLANVCKALTAGRHLILLNDDVERAALQEALIFQQVPGGVSVQGKGSADTGCRITLATSVEAAKAAAVSTPFDTVLFAQHGQHVEACTPESGLGARYVRIYFTEVDNREFAQSVERTRRVSGSELEGLRLVSLV